MFPGVPRLKSHLWRILDSRFYNDNDSPVVRFEEGRLSEDEEVHRTQSHDPVDFLRFLPSGRLLFCEG